MNHKTLAFLFFGILLANILLTAFQPPMELSNEKINQRFKQDLGKLADDLIVFQSTLSEGSRSEILESYFAARKSYKSLEYLVDYLQPEFVGDHINGAPLPKPKRKLAQLIIAEPSGFQTIDEKIAEEFTPENLQVIQNLASQLSKNWNNLMLYLNRIRLTDRQIIEAIRYELIRSYTLGITGFDTPGSAQGLKDALVVMQALTSAYEAYQPELHVLNPALDERISKTLQESVQYLKKNTDFDSFDRLEYLMKFTNPLYASFLEAQLALNIETIYEVSDYRNPLNYMAKSLFDRDFLNPYYYANLELNQRSPELKKLGKLLFFDPILSVNGKRACVSCHDPMKGFTDGNKKSIALEFKGTVERNSPTLINAVFADRYFYDLRASRMEEQFEHVVVNHQEFNTDFEEIKAKLSGSTTYKELFKNAFPNLNQPIIKYSISTALSAYLTTLTGYNSPFDQYVRGELAALDPSVKKGYNLFMGKAACGTCHFAPNFSGLVPPLYMESESEVLGVPANKDRYNPVLDTDPGRFGAKVLREETEIYLYSFKTVTVRNVALTAPYMHNGVYDSLEEVMDFYNAGGGAGLGFNLEHQTLSPDSLDLSESDKLNIIAFMKSLTDTLSMTSVPKELPEFDEMSSWNKRKIGGEY